MKENKEQWFLSFITGRGTYQEDQVRRGRGARSSSTTATRATSRRRSASPKLQVLEDSTDKKTRWIELRIPVTEGPRYRVGNFDFAGNTVVKTEALRPLFKLKKGEYYSQKKIRKGLEKAQEVYGAGGYLEFTGFPDYKFRDEPEPGRAGRRPQALGRRPRRSRRPADRRRHDAAAGRASSTSSTASRSSATRRRATTSSAASCGWSKTACSTPRR